MFYRYIKAFLILLLLLCSTTVISVLVSALSFGESEYQEINSFLHKVLLLASIALIFLFVRNKNTHTYERNLKRTPNKILLLYLFIVFVSFKYSFIFIFDKDYFGSIKPLPILYIFNVLILTPIAEELFYRGTLLKILLENNTNYSTIFLPIFITSILFACLHLEFNYLFFSHFVYSVVSSIIFIRFRTIIYPIVFHLLINLVAVILNTHKVLNQEQMLSTNFVVLTAIFLLLTICIIIKLFNHGLKGKVCSIINKNFSLFFSF
jgi:membrane protease YdiL (CAAX protease family)